MKDTKKLYEHIMASVAKEVKKALNENKIISYGLTTDVFGCRDFVLEKTRVIDDSEKSYYIFKVKTLPKSYADACNVQIDLHEFSIQLPHRKIVDFKGEKVLLPTGVSIHWGERKYNTPEKSSTNAMINVLENARSFAIKVADYLNIDYLE